METGRRVTPIPSLLLWEGWLVWPAMVVTILRVATPFPSMLLSWSHWAVAQGAQRELAALWACNRSRRAALGLWRWQLEQRREAEQWAQEQGWRQVRDALQHWPSCWQSEWGVGTGSKGEGGQGPSRRPRSPYPPAQSPTMGPPQGTPRTGVAEQDLGAWTQVPRFRSPLPFPGYVDFKQQAT